MTGTRIAQDGRGVLTITSETEFQAFGPAGFTRKEERLFDERPAQARSFGDTIRDLIGSGVAKAGEAVGSAIDDALRGFASARAPARTGAKVLRFPDGYPAIKIGPEELDVYRGVFEGRGDIPVRYVGQPELRQLTGREEEVYGATKHSVIYIDRTLAERRGEGEVAATEAHEVGHVLEKSARRPCGACSLRGFR